MVEAKFGEKTFIKLLLAHLLEKSFLRKDILITALEQTG